MLIAGDVWTYIGNSYPTKKCPPVTITGIVGNIQIMGAIDMHNGTAATDAYDGVLHLAGVTVAVNDLDLENVAVAKFDSAGGVSYINGSLSNFTGNDDPVLLAPQGQYIVYDPALNPELTSPPYQLRDLTGVSGTIGGLLLPPIPKGTLLTIH